MYTDGRRSAAKRLPLTFSLVQKTGAGQKDQALAASSKLNCDRLYFEQEIAEAVPACRLYEKRILFKWSCCDYAEFNDLREDDAQNQQTAQKILRVIRGRNIALLNIWYKDLLVKDLVPNSWPVNTEEQS